ncbi:hypothetical protein Tco_0978944 [Tanacetum coccineum]|uniref:Uncharacterized protein n=1 Tax=Tanacetum coccineum TaxID=301880 RepID=A0ABQ5EPI2_9ASTR
MIGCKVIRTLASVEIEIVLILGLPCCLSSSSVRCLESAYLDGTDTKSEPFEDPTDTETPESPLAIAPPIPLSESTPPVLVPILRRTARMAVRIPHAMSSGLSASMAEVAAMSEYALRKRFRSSCESSPSVSPPDLLLRKRYRGTSELVEDSEEDDDEEDEEIEESMDSDSVSEDTEDEGPTVGDEDPAAEDEGLTTQVKNPGMDDKGYSLDDEGHGRDDKSCGIDEEGHSVESNRLGLEEEEETVPGGQQQAAPVVGTTVSAPLGLGYRALRRRELELEESNVYSTFEVEQGSGSAPVSERPERVSAFRQPTLTTWTDPEDDMIYIDIPNYLPSAPPVQTPPLPDDHAVRLEELSPALFERYDKDIGELFARSGVVREEIFSQRYWFRSLEYGQERVAVTFRAISRPVLSFEAWAGQTDDQRVAPWHAISDVQGEN